MDQALKQRLIGAAVLVALAVIFIPMLLEAPEPEATPAGQLPLDIPARPDLPMQTRDVPLNLPQPGGATPAAPAADDPNRVVTVDAQTAPRVDALSSDAAPAATTPAPATVTPTQPVASTTPPAATPAAPATTPPAPPPATAAPVTSAPASTAPVTRPATPAAATPPPVAGPAPAASGRFVVNLGSFANAANAKALSDRLKALGIAVSSEAISVEGKPAQRLRAGPFRTRAEAEAAALRISQAEPGSKFAVGELENAAPVAAAPASRVAGGFAVQVGALKDEAEANALRERIRGAGFAAYVERAQTDAGVLWRVRAGPELQRARADTLRDQLKQRLQLDGLVVPHP